MERANENNLWAHKAQDQTRFSQRKVGRVRDELRRCRCCLSMPLVPLILGRRGGEGQGCGKWREGSKGDQQVLPRTAFSPHLQPKTTSTQECTWHCEMHDLAKEPTRMCRCSINNQFLTRPDCCRCLSKMRWVRSLLMVLSTPNT